MTQDYTNSATAGAILGYSTLIYCDIALMSQVVTYLYSTTRYRPIVAAA
jgi:hypothetical protein